MTRPRIQVVMGQEPVPAAVDDALRSIGATASFTSAQNALRYGLDPGADARIVMADATDETASLQSAGARTTGTITVGRDDSQAALIGRLMDTVAQTRAARAAVQARD